MMKKTIIQNYRTNIFGKTPNPEDVEYGEIAINYTKDSEGLYIKNNNNEIVKIESDLSNLITDEEFQPLSSLAENSIQKGSLGKINGLSIEDNDIEIDSTLYKIVASLPTENIEVNKLYLVLNSNSTDTSNVFDEYLYNPEEQKWELLGPCIPKIVLTDYYTKTEIDRNFLKKTTSTTTSLNVDKNGAISNFSNNGQAYLAVRPKTEKYLITNQYAGASFGVKDDGTSAFSHKVYTTYDQNTGNYTGAKNTAILQFAGPIGLRYAKNTGSSNDVTEQMYKYVGVIDSPDDFQRVYSSKQVDDLLLTYTQEINKLKQAIIDMGGTIE